MVRSIGCVLVGLTLVLTSSNGFADPVVSNECGEVTASYEHRDPKNADDSDSDSDENWTGAMDWYWKYTADLEDLTLTGSAEAGIEDDLNSAKLDFSLRGSKDTVFNCAGECRGEGGCVISLKNNTNGQWTAKFAGGEVALASESSWRAIDMSGVTHHTRVDISSQDGQASHTTTTTWSASGGGSQSHTVSVGANAGTKNEGANISGEVGNTRNWSGSISQTQQVVVNHTAPIGVARDYEQLTNTVIELDVGQSETRARTMSGTFSMSYQITKDGDTRWYDGGFDQIRWDTTSYNYQLHAYCGCEDPETGERIGTTRDDIPIDRDGDGVSDARESGVGLAPSGATIPAPGATTEYAVLVPAGKDGGRFKVDVMAPPEGAGFAIASVRVEPIGEATDAQVRDMTVVATQRYRLVVELAGKAKGSGSLKLVRTGSLPASEDETVTKGELSARIVVADFGFRVIGREMWPIAHANDVEGARASLADAVSVRMFAGETEKSRPELVLELARPATGDERVVAEVSDESVVRVVTPEGIEAGSRRVPIAFEGLAPGSAEIALSLAGRNVTVRATVEAPPTGEVETPRAPTAQPSQGCCGKSSTGGTASSMFLGLFVLLLVRGARRR